MKKWFSVVLDISGIACLVASLLYGRLSIGLILALFSGLLTLEILFRFRRMSFTPYQLLLLSPLILIHYVSTLDFITRLLTFLLLLYILFWVFMKPQLRIHNHHLPRRLPVVWLIALLAFVSAAVWVHSQGVYLSGDEPHYVMMAQSLANDGDLDLKNNIEEKTYREFHPLDLDFHGSEFFGRYMPFHLPGLSFLLVPFYLLFRLTGGIIPAELFFRIAAAFLNSIFAVILYNLLQKLFPDRRPAVFYWWLFFLFTFPLLFHAIHLYPELAAGSLLLLSLRLLFYGNGRTNYLYGGLCLAAIPWFHLKYSLAILVVLVFLIHKAVRHHESRRLVHLFLPLISSALLMFTYLKLCYGSFNPAVVLPSGNYFSVSHLSRLETFFSFFLDQRDGILIYAPLLLLLVFAFIPDFRKRLILFPLIAGTAAAYLLFHAFTTIRGAYSPAARPLMFVYGLLIILLINLLLFNRNKFCAFLVRLTAGLTLFSTFWIWLYPLFIYQPVTSATVTRGSVLVRLFSSQWINLESLLPSFLRFSNAGHWANLAWLAAIAGVIILFYFRRKQNGRSQDAGLWSSAKMRALLVAALMITVLLLACYFPHLNLSGMRSMESGEFRFFTPSGNLSYIVDRGEFRLKVAQEVLLIFDLRAQEQKVIQFDFLNLDPVTVELSSGRQPLFESGRESESNYRMFFSELNRFRFKGRWYGFVSIKTGTAVSGKTSALYFKI